MFNLKNKIISWYYTYTDKLLVSKLKREIARNQVFLNDTDNYLDKINIYFGIPGLVFVFTVLFLDRLLSEKQMYYIRYPMMIYFCYILLASLVVVIWTIVFSIRKKSLSNLLILSIVALSITSHAFLQQFLEDNRYFSFNQNIKDIINFMSSCVFLLVVILGIKLIKKSKKL